MPIKIPFAVFLCCVLLPQQVFAGAALVQVQQAKMRKAQAQAQAEYQAKQQYEAMQMQQQAAAQQQYAQVQQAQAYMAQQQMIQAQLQQQIANYIQQQQIEQVEKALVMRYVQQELQQRMQQAQVQQLQDLQQQAIQEAIVNATRRAMMERAAAQRDKDAAAAYLQARDQAIAMYQQQAAYGAATQVVAAREVAQQQAAQQVAQELGVAAYVSGMKRPFEPNAQDNIRQIVGIEELWKNLDKKATAWPLIIDNYAKVLTVKEYIERFRQENIKIQQQPAFYAHMLDDMAAQNPAMLERPFKDVVQLLAVMEYDFDNGMDRDFLIQKLLGQEFYAMNKKRLGR